MEFLTGSSSHQMDGKGRIRIPSKFRALLGNELSFMAGQDCICIYPKEALDAKVAKMLAVTPNDEERYNAVRRVLATIEPIKEDDQGRIVVPPQLRLIAGLEKEIYTIGMIDHLEVWAESFYLNTVAPSREKIKNDIKVIGV